MDVINLVFFYKYHLNLYKDFKLKKNLSKDFVNNGEKNCVYKLYIFSQTKLMRQYAINNPQPTHKFRIKYDYFAAGIRVVT